MNYQQAKDAIFTCGTVPNGWHPSGHVRHIRVGFAFDAESGKTLIVHADGFHNSVAPPALDRNEAFWLLKNHPACKRLYKIESTK